MTRALSVTLASNRRAVLDTVAAFGIALFVSACTSVPQSTVSQLDDTTTVPSVTETPTTAPSPTVPPVTAEPVLEFDPGPLSPRRGHSMVWTGTEVIIWGGHTDNYQFPVDDGGAFNPSTGEWRRIASAPIAGMTWHFSAWDGGNVIVIGSAGIGAYNPTTDTWREFTPPPIRVHKLADTISDLSVFAWSGQRLYMWNPANDELASFDPASDTWQTIEGPGLDVHPAKVLAQEDRLLTFGTRWPGRPSSPPTYDLLGAELIDGTWIDIPPIDFLTSTYANVADPGTATFYGDTVLVWGDPSPDPGSARILNTDHEWVMAPPPPIDENILHPTPIPLSDGRILALSEGGNAAIWEPSLADWTPVGILPAILGREAVWTGQEVIAWASDGAWRWTPPPPTNVSE